MRQSMRSLEPRRLPRSAYALRQYSRKFVPPITKRSLRSADGFKFSSLLPTFLVGRGNLSSPLPEGKEGSAKAAAVEPGPGPSPPALRKRRSGGGGAPAREPTPRRY